MLRTYGAEFIAGRWDASGATFARVRLVCRFSARPRHGLLLRCVLSLHCYSSRSTRRLVPVHAASAFPNRRGSSRLSPSERRQGASCFTRAGRRGAPPSHAMIVRMSCTQGHSLPIVAWRDSWQLAGHIEDALQSTTSDIVYSSRCDIYHAVRGVPAPT